MINSRQRAQLRGLANTIEAIFQIGKGGISEELVKGIEEALEARELVKVKALESAPETVRELAQKVAQAVHADVVQVIGRRFVLYKESREHRTIALVK